MRERCFGKRSKLFRAGEGGGGGVGGFGGDVISAQHQNYLTKNE